MMNILVYYPNGHQKRVDLKWLYGIDIIEKLKEKHSEWDFKVADGSIKKDKLYNNIDIYLRPTRHDGMARMILEAKSINIPIIWSYETGKYVKPNIHRIERRLKKIESSKSKRMAG